MDKINAQLAELLIRVTEIQTSMKKAEADAIMDRISKLEQNTERLMAGSQIIETYTKNLNIKFDSATSVDIPAIINPPTGPTTVRVAGGEDEKAQPQADATVAAATAGGEPLKQKFTNIIDFFKHMWVTDKQILFDKKIITEELVKKATDENQDKAKKSKNDIVLQKSIAATVWKYVAQPQRDIVKSMKSQYENNVNKANSIEIKQPE
jgi:hypothetical protein